MNTPTGRLGEPDEVASIAVFRASEDSSYITGQTIYPDGGRLALNYTVPVAEQVRRSECSAVRGKLWEAGHAGF